MVILCFSLKQVVFIILRVKAGLAPGSEKADRWNVVCYAYKAYALKRICEANCQERMKEFCELFQKQSPSDSPRHVKNLYLNDFGIL